MVSVAEEKIDLNNFEHPKYVANRHVLNSPRSIRACFNVGVAPKDLLRRPLGQFDHGDGYANAYHRQQEHDQIRLSLLKMARRERRRLIRDEESRREEPVGNRQTTSNALLGCAISSRSAIDGLAHASERTAASKLARTQPSWRYQRHDRVLRARERKAALDANMQAQQVKQAKRHRDKRNKAATRREQQFRTASLYHDLSARVGPMAVQQRVEDRLVMQSLLSDGTHQ
eukprot:TRINITY_DN14219_c0_g1_i1.p1 TRINITY_DN14219_c0_g1~~TRINITY_DN14219_c0_g1_i1.p1  ORF type:complete len:229 (+),score=32.17 TRINITY_DN14219_c0_g1_i1:136-822(+)